MEIILKKRKVKKVELSTLCPKDTFRYKDPDDKEMLNFIVLDDNCNVHITDVSGNTVGRNTKNKLVMYLGNGSIGYVPADKKVIKTDAELTING